jgi:uncharacterized membrane protein
MARGMIASLVMGIVAGSRSLTPLAAVSLLARRRRLPGLGPLATLLASPWVSAGATVLAIAELLGDKMRSAPDRTVPPGMAARLLTGGIAGAALADDRKAGAVAGAAAAVASSYVTLAIRKRFIARHGQRPTGIVEDVLVVALALWVVGWAGEARSRP